MNAPVTLDGRARRAIEAEIERLISLLDLMDPDPDLEPWLAGGTEVVDTLDKEQDTCDDEDDGSAEPSLGAPERHHPASRDTDPHRG